MDRNRTEFNIQVLFWTWIGPKFGSQKYPKPKRLDTWMIFHPKSPGQCLKPPPHLQVRDHVSQIFPYWLQAIYSPTNHHQPVMVVMVVIPPNCWLKHAKTWENPGSLEGAQELVAATDRRCYWWWFTSIHVALWKNGNRNPASTGYPLEN